MRDGGNKRYYRKFDPVTTVSAMYDPKLIGEAERDMSVIGQKNLRRRNIRLTRIHIL